MIKKRDIWMLVSISTMLVALVSSILVIVEDIENENKKNEVCKINGYEKYTSVGKNEVCRYKSGWNEKTAKWEYSYQPFEYVIKNGSSN